MTDDGLPELPPGTRLTGSEAVLNALPLPVLTIGGDERILQCNHAAEAFFDYSARLMQRRRLRDIIPFASPIIALVAEVRRRKASVSEYRVELTQPRLGIERSVDVFATPLDDSDAVVMMLQERTIADKMNRQLTHGAPPDRWWRSAQCSPTRSRTRWPASAARRSSWKAPAPRRTGCSPA